MSGNVSSKNILIKNFLLNEVIIHFNVLGAGMKDKIRGEREREH